MQYILQYLIYSFSPRQYILQYLIYSFSPGQYILEYLIYSLSPESVYITILNLLPSVQGSIDHNKFTSSVQGSVHYTIQYTLPVQENTYNNT
jgi:hypothetical protein